MALRKIPQPLYKYTSADRAKQILSSRSIRFTQPKFLNDPYEMRLTIDPESLRADIVAREVVKGMSILDAEREALRKLEDWAFSLVDVIKNQRDELGVLSLSEVPDGLLMWAHYAAQHEGVAIGLCLESCLLPPNANPDALVWFDDVKYVNEKIDFIKDHSAIWQSLLRKSEEWHYEREWRIIRTLNTLTAVSSDVYVSELWPEAIDCIVLGARMSPKDETEVLNQLDSSPDFAHVKRFKSVVRSDILGVQIIPYEQWALRAFHGYAHWEESWREVHEWIDLKRLGTIVGADVKPDP
jgi:hypothetical protein